MILTEHKHDSEKMREEFCLSCQSSYQYPHYT